MGVCKQAAEQCVLASQVLAPNYSRLGFCGRHVACWRVMGKGSELAKLAGLRPARFASPRPRLLKVVAWLWLCGMVVVADCSVVEGRLGAREASGPKSSPPDFEGSEACLCESCPY